MVFRVAMIWWCLLASMARGLEPCLDDACEADSADSALSLRQLRGQQFEAQVYEHQEGMEKSPGGAEGTEDPYSKAPDADTAAAEAAAPAATEAPAETQGEGTEDTYSKPTEAETEKPAAEAPAAEEPAAEEPAAEKPAAEEPAAEEPAESEESTMTQEKWEEKQGGLCCFSGEDWHDTCGSCYPTAIASFKSPCASSADKCGTCGGSWCQPKCVMGAADPNNKCKTAFDTGIADGKSLCAANATSCASCKGEWCRLGVTKVAGGAGVVNSGNSAVASSTAAAATGGFCCYRGKAFAPDMCGACADVSQDIACANSKGCGSCGGTWCAGPRCVKAFSDKKNPCGSAFKGNVAPLSDYCAGSELRCSDCGGAWCSASNITYDDGVKFNPDGEEASSSESDSADSTDSADDDFPDDEGDIQPEGYEPLTDLLPGGLAKKA